jgi:hypothetical protein
MAYRDLFGALHFVTVLQVEPPAPDFNNFAPDPGPRAA